MSSLPFQEILQREAERAIRTNLAAVVDALRQGRFDEFLPGIQKQRPEEVREDALDRSKRTLLQQLGVDMVIALATIVGPLLISLDVTSKAQWTFIGLSVLKTIISTLVAYSFRLLYAPKEESQISLAEAKRVE